MRLPLHVYIDQIFVSIYIIKLCNALKIKLDKSIKTLIFKQILCINILVCLIYIYETMMQFYVLETIHQTTMCGIVALKKFQVIITVLYFILTEKSDCTTSIYIAPLIPQTSVISAVHTVTISLVLYRHYNHKYSQNIPLDSVNTSIYLPKYLPLFLYIKYLNLVN